MSPPPSATDPANGFDPHPGRPAAYANSPTDPRHLLGLIRALITYGRQLASTLQDRSGATDLTDIARNFGTMDIAQIIACITRGLHRAAALEARLVLRLARQADAQATASAVGAAPRRKPRAARPVDPTASPADPHLARLPTPAEIVAQVRRRPVGAVFADICRDFGIVPADSLWQELALPIIANGGNLATLLKDTLQRLFARITDPPGTSCPVRPRQRRPFTLAATTDQP